ncbi:MAG: hypothetical protein E7351_00735 [Clostridiales bacterium]|nr:hypothetical protein [Clostridiales bacterium]
MKVIFVVDSITELNNKINLLRNRFGDNILFVVKANILKLFETYGHRANAIYYNNLTRVIQVLLSKADSEDTVICYASLNFDNNLLNKFISKIGDKSRVVNLMPRYNTYEKVCNSAYNIYVKSLFKVKDSMASPKLQFMPAAFVDELLDTHLGNRLFEINENLCVNISLEDKEINNSMKVKTNLSKFGILALIIALVLTAGLLATIAYWTVNYLVILIFTVLYILDILVWIIFMCKTRFDQRFLK